MKLLPWSATEEALGNLEKQPGLEKYREAKRKFEQLAPKTYLPGVGSRLDGYRRRLLAGRIAAFAAAVEAREEGEAAKIIEEFPLPDRAAEETLNLAALRSQAGRDFGSLAGISPERLPAPLLATYFRLRTAELQTAGDTAGLLSCLARWQREIPEENEPARRLSELHLGAGEYEAAAAQLDRLPPLERSEQLVRLAAHAAIPLAMRAHFCLLIRENLLAEALLDEMLRAEPENEWALTARAQLAETSETPSSARLFYARLAALKPEDATLARRLAELAQNENDTAGAEAHYEAAWQAGDEDAGLKLARLRFTANQSAGADTAEKVAEGATDPTLALTAADLVLDAGRTRAAADLFRRVCRMDMRLAERAIGRAHAWVEAKKPDRLPLLEFLWDVAPARGYPAESYHLMAAEDLAATGKRKEALEQLEFLTTTELRWKALAEIARFSLEDTPVQREAMARRLEMILPQAENAGRRHWAELAYFTARLWESLDNRTQAASWYEQVIGREFEFRDATERLAKLRLAGSAPAAAAPADADHTVVLARPEGAARYERIAMLGRGGMGEVWKARDRMLDRLVALKVLTTAGAGAEDSIVREARATAKLNHPNIVAIYDVGKESGNWHIAMELVEGPTLKEMLKAGPFARPAAAVVMRSLLSALGVAHAAGVIHRDLKPANIMLRAGEVKAENVKLMDFGLARVAHDSSIVMPGMAAGTAAYMAPEQIRGGAIDGRTDLYACGCILYEMLTAQPLFAASDLTTTMFQHLNEDPARLMKNDILADPPLARLLLGFLTREPEERFASTAEAARAVEEFEKQDRRPACPAGGE